MMIGGSFCSSLVGRASLMPQRLLQAEFNLHGCQEYELQVSYIRIAPAGEGSLLICFSGSHGISVGSLGQYYGESGCQTTLGYTDYRLTRGS